MPHRRKPAKGSFGTHLDELVEHFPDQHRPARQQDKGGKAERDKRSVHERLLASSWRKAHGGSRHADH